MSMATMPNLAKIENDGSHRFATRPLPRPCRLQALGSTTLRLLAQYAMLGSRHRRARLSTLLCMPAASARLCLYCARCSVPDAPTDTSHATPHRSLTRAAPARTRPITAVRGCVRDGGEARMADTPCFIQYRAWLHRHAGQRERVVPLQTYNTLSHAQSHPVTTLL